MSVSKPIGFKSVAGFFDSSGKIVAAFISLIVVIYTVSVFFYKLNQTIIAIDQVKAEQKHIHEDDQRDNKQRIDELVKDTKIQFEDQHELIIKTMQRNRELENEVKNNQIELAEWKGRVATLLKMK